MTSTPPVVLTIAGSDSGGGAGIQADLKTFAAHGAFGTSALTAVTAQNTRGVQAVHAIPPDIVEAQVTSVVDDFDVVATKTGMLARLEIVQIVAACAATGRLRKLVVDPVMVATSGDRLLDQAAEEAYLELLFPHALVITPNLAEAGALLGRTLRTMDDAERAAMQLSETGAEWVVVKGGHLTGSEAVDVVVHDGEVRLLRAPRVPTANVHGTGCTFAAAIAAQLALGRAPWEALVAAKDYLTRALVEAARWRLGEGAGPVHHLYGLDRSIAEVQRL
ncbi:MAG: hydroxymethylpyrimidine/phosphomethylpyrimidine kinase [Acidimicrobiia bacterium]|jgi:hydroxymethylpyrimidine/phosphomethylpyrimidine kinase|nr:hydroxymethylpyrimidine/phosphomethylpyrimidine kinase [Acidimicrobiia bacterium]